MFYKSARIQEVFEPNPDLSFFFNLRKSSFALLNVGYPFGTGAMNTYLCLHREAGRKVDQGQDKGGIGGSHAP